MPKPTRTYLAIEEAYAVACRGDYGALDEAVGHAYLTACREEAFCFTRGCHNEPGGGAFCAACDARALADCT